MATIVVQQEAIDVLIEVTVLENDAPMDISAATTHTFVVRKPSGATATWLATFMTDGVNGKLQYITVAGDLNERGRYRLQAQLVIPGTYTGKSTSVSFWVAENVA
jgi:hypothetical protein